MATLRSEFGPGLPDLLAVRLGWPVRRTRRLVLGLAAALVLVQAARVVLSTGTSLTRFITVSEPVAFNLGHRDGLERVAPRTGEVLRLQAVPGSPTRETFTVSELRLEPFPGDPAGVLPVLAAREVDRLRASFPRDFRYRGDGRTRVNESPGHQILFQTRIDGRLVYGKRFFLLPELEPPAQAREGVVVTLLSRYSAATPSVEAVGVVGQLKGPLRSFRFGTQRP